MAVEQDKEIWKPIPGYPGYEASSQGRVRPPRKILKQTPVARGAKHKYWAVGIGHSNMVLVHKLVALAFLGLPSDGEEVCHCNGDGRDNRPENLRWGTRKSNVSDTFIHGTANIGSRNGQAKLTEKEVLEIRILAASTSQRALARIFGVGQSTISRIVRHEGWTKSCP